MIVGEMRNQIDSIWNDFWSGGLSNPLSVMEQITFLLFIKRLDDLQTVEERKAAMLKQPLERRIFPGGLDPRGRPHADLRWSAFQLLESDSEVHAGLQSLRNMRRMDAKRRNMRAVRLRFSQPLASRRQRLSQAIVRSTIQRLGSVTKPFA
jgi:type I restriction enzyme M protein